MNINTLKCGNRNTAVVKLKKHKISQSINIIGELGEIYLYINEMQF